MGFSLAVFEAGNFHLVLRFYDWSIESMSRLTLLQSDAITIILVLDTHFGQVNCLEQTSEVDAACRNAQCLSKQSSLPQSNAELHTLSDGSL